MSLMELQRRMAEQVMRPLTIGRAEADFIKPNERLTSIERLQIYNRQYWFRVLDSMYEDFPGLCAIVGQRAFHRLASAYIADSPSQSFSLRDLGSRLEDWLRLNPAFTPKRTELAVDMARLEWAHIEAWDGASEKALEPEDLVEPGAGLRIRLQPYITLLALRYPVDELRVQVSGAIEDHGTASNAVREHKHRAVSLARRLKPRELYVAVHRVDFSIYYRRLEREEFLLLEALRAGSPVGKAIGIAFEGGAVPAGTVGRKLETWFATWSELGWLCPGRKRGRRE